MYDYSIINVGNANAEQIEKQVLVFENARVLPIVEEGKVGVGLYKLDRDTCDLTDEAPYTDGCKTRASLLNGGSNRADIPADANMVAGAVYALYTADDIYSIPASCWPPPILCWAQPPPMKTALPILM